MCVCVWVRTIGLLLMGGSTSSTALVKPSPGSFGADGKKKEKLIKSTLTPPGGKNRNCLKLHRNHLCFLLIIYTERGRDLMGILKSCLRTKTVYTRNHHCSAIVSISHGSSRTLQWNSDSSRPVSRHGISVGGLKLLHRPLAHLELLGGRRGLVS